MTHDASDQSGGPGDPEDTDADDAPDDRFAAPAADEPHPDVQQLLATIDAMDAPDLHTLAPEAARSLYDTAFAGGDPAAEVANVTDQTVPGPAGDLPVRVYDPGVDGTPPTVVYLHGGGFVLGGLDTHDDTCRVLCDTTDALVVSVDYRLAPEHPFPAAVADCYAAVEHLASHADEFGGDPDRLALAGDSAGATLSSAVTLLARDRARRGEDTPDVAHQVLAYPATDPGEDYHSMRENAEGYFLTTADMEYFADHYLAHELHAANRYAFPMAARDCGDLPPTTVLTAGFDPLRDEGAAFAERLAREGTPVTFRHYPAMIHGFLSMLGPFEVAGAREAMADVAGDLADTLAD